MSIKEVNNSRCVYIYIYTYTLKGLSCKNEPARALRGANCSFSLAVGEALSCRLILDYY